jgi:transposase
MIKNSRMYVGIDLHKSVIQVCVLDSDGKTVSETRHTGSSLKEGLEVVQHLARWKRVAQVCVESVGMNRWFVNACVTAGLEVIVVDPVKLNLRMLGKKTDRRDAYEIARRLRLGDVARNAQTYYPTEEEYAFRKLLRTRHKLVHLRQQLTNQVRGLLAAYRLPCPTSALYIPKNLKILSAIELPNQMLHECHESIVAALHRVQASINDLTTSLERKTRRSKANALIEHVPSVGFQTAATLFYELGDVSRFKSAKAAASYAGLVPRVAASADKSHHGKITKRGNPELRWILSQMAVRLMSRDPRVQAWAGPRLRRTHKNKVRITLARRLLVGVYYMLRHGEAFDLNRCLGLPVA